MQTEVAPLSLSQLLYCSTNTKIPENVTPNLRDQQIPLSYFYPMPLLYSLYPNTFLQ